MDTTAGCLERTAYLEVKHSLVDAVFDPIRLPHGDGVVSQQGPQGAGSALGQRVQKVPTLKHHHDFPRGKWHEHARHLPVEGGSQTHLPLGVPEGGVVTG